MTPAREPVSSADGLPVTPLPCPFCDHDYPEFVDQGSGPPPMQAIVCGWCGAKGPGGLGFERGDIEGAKRAAVKEWNRAPRPKKDPEPGTLAALFTWPVEAGLARTVAYYEGSGQLVFASWKPPKGRGDNLQCITVPAADVAGFIQRNVEAAHAEPPPEVIEAFARECRCCPCCRQCPCPGVMAGGVCDDFECVHEEPSDWNDGDDDIPEMGEP